jgi:ABC-2 type transport system permease protein
MAAESVPTPRRVPRSIFDYIRLWVSLLRNAFVRELEFKTNFIGRACVEIIWIGTQTVFFTTAMRFMDRFGNLDREEIWLFMGTMFFLDGLFMLFIHDNQLRFGGLIREGLMDFHLLRPVSSLFLAMFRYVNVVSITNLVIAGGVVGYAFWHLHLPPERMLIWAVYTGSGLLLTASIVVLACSLCFWTVQSSNLVWLFYELYRLGWRPESLYGDWLRRILLSVFPAAFFVSVPVQLTLGKRDGWWFVFPWIAVATVMALTHGVWKRGIRRYEGALS